MISLDKFRASSFFANEKGLAMLEFALSLPVILTMGLAGTELAHMALVTERVNQIAMLTADNAARVRDTIDETDVNQIMVGAKYVGQSINFAAKGRIILSDVQNNPLNTGQWIRWQRCAGAKNFPSSYGVEGKGQTDATLSAIGPTGNQIAASAGSIVMFVEVAYDYQPIVPVTNYFGVLPAGLFTAKQIRVTQAFNVRQRNPANDKNSSGLPLSSPPSDITNTTSLADAQKSSCSLFTA
jgi:hypothetical protein